MGCPPVILDAATWWKLSQWLRCVEECDLCRFMNYRAKSFKLDKLAWQL
jgi:hypothetical protein